MKTYISIMKQDDLGCGNTIRCGEKTILVRAETFEDAKRQVVYEMYMDDYINGTCDPSVYLTGEFALSSWLLYEVSDEYVDMMPMLREAWNMWDEAERIREQDREREEYERLRKKFGE